jgi:coatomer protein complex subunit gamma
LLFLSNRISYTFLDPFPLQNIDKIQVLQETRVFNDTPIKPRQCVFLITKLLYCLGQGEVFNATEATDIFFNLTKLFISEDVRSTIT